MKFNVWFADSAAEITTAPHLTIEAKEVEHYGENLHVLPDTASQIATLIAWVQANDEEPRAWDCSDLDDNPPYALASETRANGLRVDWWYSHDGESYAIERLPFDVTIRPVVAEPKAAPAEVDEIDSLAVPSRFTLSDLLTAYAALDGEQAEEFVATWDAALAQLHDRSAVLARVGATLGAWERWPGSELLSTVAAEMDRFSTRTGLPNVGDGSALVEWRARADRFGIDHDGEE